MDEIDYNTPEYDADDSDIEEEDRDESLDASFVRRKTALEIFKALLTKDEVIQDTLIDGENIEFIYTESVLDLAQTYGISESDLALTKENEGD